jgi:hypothetical protein
MWIIKIKELIMTDLKYFILGVLYKSRPRQESKINLINLKFDTPTATGYAIDELIEAKFIKPVLGTDKVELTPSGANAYEEANEERKNQAKQERQQRFENKVSIATVLVPLVTFILGIIVESQVNIVDWILALFT